MTKKHFYLTSAYILGIILSSTGYCSFQEFSNNEEGLRLRKPLLKKNQDNQENVILLSKNSKKNIFETQFKKSSSVLDFDPIVENYMLLCKTKGISCDLENFESTLTSLAFESKNRERFDKIAIHTFQIPNTDLDKYYKYFSNIPVEKAKLLISQAAEKGNIEALYKMGAICESEYNMGQNYHANATLFYKKAAKRGHILAQYNLGIIYTESQDAQDLKEAVYWFRKAARQGDRDAQFNLGTLYSNGFSIRKNLEEASYWFHQAAQQGETEAQFALGQMYFQGQGVEQNVGKALEWFERSAQGKNSDACFYLGNLKLKTQLYPSLLPEEALIWYMRAAFLDHVEAMVRVGLIYYAGIGTPQESFPLFDNTYKDFITDDLKKWWTKASEDEKACFWWRKAADKGSAEAQFYLGWMYEKNYVSQKNDNEDHQKLARKFYQKAAAKGDISAMIKLGQATLKDLTETDHESFQIWKELAKNEKMKKLAGYATFVSPIYFNLLTSVGD